MSSVADVWNQALGTVGVADEIQDPDREISKEATACRRFWPGVRDQVLRDFPWPRLGVTAALTLVDTDPNDQWGYSYRLPADVARVIRVFVSCSPVLDTTGTRIPYKLGRDSAGDLLYANLADLQIEYTYAETNVERYPADLVDALGLLLAAKIAPRFGPEAVKLGDRAFQLYRWRLNVARATALNEEQGVLDDSSDLERARDG